MKEIQKTSIEPSDLVIVDGQVYRADLKTKGECSAQCSLYRPEEERCTGTCYRWANADAIVFRHIMPAGLLRGDAEVCVTPTWSEWEACNLEREALRKKQYNTKGGGK